MKWIFLNPIKAGQWGGMENWMANLSRGLTTLGDDCLIVGRPSSRWPQVCREHSIPFAPFDFGLDLAPWALVRLRALCRDFTPDVGIAKGFRQCRFLRVACPSTAIGTKMPNLGELTDAFVDRWTCRLCVDRVLVDNHLTRLTFLKHPWVLPNKILAVHNGVAQPSSAEIARARKLIRRQWNIPDTVPIVAAAGRLSPEKGFSDVLEALARCGAEHSPRLVLFGEGPEKAALAQRAERLGLADRVVLAGWRDEARLWIPGADVFIHASRSEGLPNVVLEALAGGVPTLATDAGGTREILANSNAGFVVPCGDVDALAGRLRALLQDSRLRQAMSRNAVEHVRRFFSLESMTRGVRTIMESAWQSRQMLRDRGVRLHAGRGPDFLCEIIRPHRLAPAGRPAQSPSGPPARSPGS